MWLLPDLNCGRPNIYEYGDVAEYVKKRLKQVNELPCADFRVEFDEDAAKENIKDILDINGCDYEVPMIELNINLKYLTTTRTVVGTKTEIIAYYEPSIDLTEFYKPYL